MIIKFRTHELVRFNDYISESSIRSDLKSEIRTHKICNLLHNNAIIYPIDDIYFNGYSRIDGYPIFIIHHLDAESTLKHLSDFMVNVVGITTVEDSQFEKMKPY